MGSSCAKSVQIVPQEPISLKAEKETNENEPISLKAEKETNEKEIPNADLKGEVGPRSATKVHISAPTQEETLPGRQDMSPSLSNFEPRPDDPDPSDHPLFKTEGFPGPVEGLSVQSRLLTILAAHAAKGDAPALKQDWSFFPNPLKDSGFEILLQVIVAAGIAKTINAFVAVKDVDPQAVPEEKDKGYSNDQFSRKGLDLNKTIYGHQYEKLRQRIAFLHPDLDLWMIEFCYGRVMSRPGPSLRDRELCLLSMLCGLDCAPQVLSHIRGSIRAGATNDQITAIIDQTAFTWGPEAHKQVSSVWGDFLSKAHARL